MTKPLARYVLAALNYLKVEAPEEMKKFDSLPIDDWAGQWVLHCKLTEEQALLLYDGRAGEYPRQIGLKTGIERLENYVKNKRDDLSDLISDIADVLTGDFSRNRLAGDVINDLRHVILRGDEAFGLRKRLKENILSCTGCGHKFQSLENEACTIIRRPDNETVIKCAKCAYPRVWACSSQGCDDVGRVDSIFQTAWLKQVEISSCGGKHKKAESQTEDQTVVRPRSARTNPAVRNLFHAVGQDPRVAINWPPPTNPFSGDE
jgi:hypothetical protein